jgi:O-antigen/teichoic acid export membrane protein
LANLGALLLGQGVTAGIQLASLPIFFHFWDAQRYGKWVILSAVPAYFSMSDAGMIPVAANKVSMLQAGGNAAAANAVFQSALALVVGAFLIIGSGSGIVLLLLGNAVLDGDSRLALWILILSTLLGLFAGLFGASFRACGRNARGVLYNDGIRILEFTGLAAGLALGRSFAFTALGLFLGRLFASIFVVNECRRLCPDLKWDLRNASVTELRALFKPAVGYLAFPLGNGLGIQGITLVVGALFGSVVVAIFSTYRTLSRLVIQVTATIGNAILPEFSRLYGSSDVPTLRKLYRYSMFVGITLSIVASLASIPFAPLILRVWTHDKIPFDEPLFLLFALATLVGGLTHVPRSLLLATNNHSNLGLIYLGLSAAGVVLAILLGRSIGASGTVLAMTLPEAGMFILATLMGSVLLRSLPSGKLDE